MPRRPLRQIARPSFRNPLILVALLCSMLVSSSVQAAHSDTRPAGPDNPARNPAALMAGGSAALPPARPSALGPVPRSFVPAPLAAGWHAGVPRIRRDGRSVAAGRAASLPARYQADGGGSATSTPTQTATALPTDPFIYDACVNTGNPGWSLVGGNFNSGFYLRSNLVIYDVTRGWSIPSNPNFGYMDGEGGSRAPNRISGPVVGPFASGNPANGGYVYALGDTVELQYTSDSGRIFSNPKGFDPRMPGDGRYYLARVAGDCSYPDPPPSSTPVSGATATSIAAATATATAGAPYTATAAAVATATAAATAATAVARGPVLPSSQARGQAACPCQSANPSGGGPFNIRTGNLWTSATDLVVSSPGPALAWSRSYNSQATGDADYGNSQGYGWQVRYLTHLVTSGRPGGEPGVAIVADATGDRLRFSWLGGGQYLAYPGVYAALVGNGDGTYTETNRGQDTVTFDTNGRATAMADGHGGRLNLIYDASNRLSRVQDAQDATRFLQVDYAADGVHVADVKDPAGRTVQYAIDANGDLTGTTDVLQRHVTYHYQSHLLTGIDNNMGQHEEQTTYDQYTPAGRVIVQTEQDGRRIAVDYQADHTTLTTTGSDGTTTDTMTYQYDPIRNTLAGVLHNGVQVRQVHYDAHFSPGSSADGNGNGTTVVSNGMGLPTSVTNALNATSSVAYDAQSRPQLATDALGRKTQLTYDAAGNLTQLSEQGANAGDPQLVATYSYNVRYPGKNRLEQETAPDGVVTYYDYDSAGKVTDLIVGYGSATPKQTGYAYDGVGRVVAVTYAQGTALARTDRTDYYDDNTIKDAIQNYQTGTYSAQHPDQDIVTRYGYDALGRRVWVQDTLGRVDATHYNAAGQVDWALRDLQPATPDGNGGFVIPSSPPAYDPAHPDRNVATLYGYDPLGRQSLVTQTGILAGSFSPATRTFSAATTRATKIDYNDQGLPQAVTENYQAGQPVNTLPDVNVQTRYQIRSGGEQDLGARSAEPLDRDALRRPEPAL